MAETKSGAPNTGAGALEGDPVENAAAGLLSASMAAPEDGNTKSDGTKMVPGSTESDIEGMPSLENTASLSPQWLSAKPSDIKTSPSSPELPCAAVNPVNDQEMRKTDGKYQHTDQRQAWWRTSSDTGRHDSWREEERQINVDSRRDRRKDVADGTDSRHSPDKSAGTKDVAESTVGGRSDALSRETKHELRRDNRWNTRWGPEDKEKESQRGKRLDSDKEGLGYKDRTHNSRNELESEVDSSRVWRRHSFVSRSKGELPPLSSSTPNKYALSCGSAKGRGDGSAAGFATSRGRGVLSTPPLSSSIGYSMKARRSDVDQAYCYQRGRILDIYRANNGSFLILKPPEGFVEVPQLTQVEALEPLALFAPDTDEEAVLEGISKGEICSSGASRPSFRDSSSRKGRIDETTCHSKVVSTGTGKMSEHRSAGYAGQHEREGPAESSGKSNTSVEGQDSLLEIRKTGNRESTKESARLVEKCSGTDAMRGSSIGGVNQENIEASDKHAGDSSSGSIELEDEKETLETLMSRILTELSLFYTDPQGDVQGPFPIAEIISWLEAGYFGIDLPVHIADAPGDTPFVPLGDVILQFNSKLQAALENNLSITAMKNIPASKLLQEAILDSSVQKETLIYKESALQHAPGGAYGEAESFQQEDLDVPLITADDLKRGEAIGKLLESQGNTSFEKGQPLKTQAWIPACVKEEDVDVSKVAFQPHHWLGSDELLQTAAGTGMQKRGVDFPPLDLPASLPVLDRGISNVLGTMGAFTPSTLPPGLDAFQLHQLQQLEQQRLQQFELAQFEHLLRQQQALFSALPDQQYVPDGAPLHKLLNPLIPPAGINSFEHLPSLHPLPTPQSSLSLPEESMLDQIFRLKQQLQSHQLNPTPDPIFEKILAQWPHTITDDLSLYKNLNKLNCNPQVDIKDQYSQQILQDVALENFLRRQQEQEVREQVNLLRQKMNFHVRGIPSGMLTQEAAQHWQQLHPQASCQVDYPSAQSFLELQNAEGLGHPWLQQSEFNMRKSPDIQMGTDFPDSWRCRSSMEGMQADSLADSQQLKETLGWRKSLPNLHDLELEAIRNQARIEEAVTRRGWNKGHHGTEPPHLNDIFRKSGFPSFDQLTTNDLVDENWQNANNNLSMTSTQQIVNPKTCPILLDKCGNGSKSDALRNDLDTFSRSSSALLAQVASITPKPECRQLSDQYMLPEDHRKMMAIQGIRLAQPQQSRDPWDFVATSSSMQQLVNQQWEDVATMPAQIASDPLLPDTDVPSDVWIDAIKGLHHTGTREI